MTPAEATAHAPLRNASTIDVNVEALEQKGVSGVGVERELSVRNQLRERVTRCATPAYGWNWPSNFVAASSGPTT
jgi:hypothetical protein